MRQNTSVAIKNIYYMLCYAFQALRPDDLEQVETEEFDHIHNLFAAILAQGMGRQLKQGLHRDYLEHSERLPTLRGGVDLGDTIRVRLAQKRQIACRFDELSENNLLNQILKQTTLLLLRHGDVKPRYRDDLRKRLLFFGGVESIDPRAIRWSEVRVGRNGQGYRLLIGLCQLILTGMLLSDASGGNKLNSFVDDQAMHRLFEKFILEYYARDCRLAKASSPRIPWALDDGQSQLLPTMQSDVVLSDRTRTLIIDAKYYTKNTQQHFDTHKMISANLYQIFTYVKNKEAELAETAHEVSGMLLYAKTDADTQPDNSYRMSGNRISVRTLDLNQEFEGIKSELDAIAHDHFAA